MHQIIASLSNLKLAEDYKIINPHPADWENMCGFYDFAKCLETMMMSEERNVNDSIIHSYES